MNTFNRPFPTRGDARAFRKTVNSKAPATLRDPVKDDRGLWVIPGINHGSKLRTPAGIIARIQRG